MTLWATQFWQKKMGRRVAQKMNGTFGAALSVATSHGSLIHRFFHGLELLEPSQTWLPTILGKWNDLVSNAARPLLPEAHWIRHLVIRLIHLFFDPEHHSNGFVVRLQESTSFSTCEHHETSQRCPFGVAKFNYTLFGGFLSHDGVPRVIIHFERWDFP